MRASGAFKECEVALADLGPMRDFSGRAWLHRSAGPCGPGYYEVDPKVLEALEASSAASAGSSHAPSSAAAAVVPKAAAAADDEEMMVEEEEEDEIEDEIEEEMSRSVRQKTGQADSGSAKAAAREATLRAGREGARKALSDAMAGHMAPAEAKPRRKWTSDEEQKLRTGVDKHGEGHWELIRTKFGFRDRTGQNLKDKWRTMKQQGAQQGPSRMGTLQVD